MAQLTTIEKKILEKLFRMDGGYVIDFTNRSFEDFFRDDVGVDIYSEKYNHDSGSKANRLRRFWYIEPNEPVGLSIAKMVEYIENQILLDNLHRSGYPLENINAVVKMAERLIGGKITFKKEENKSQASFINGNINIQLQKEIFDHVQQLLQDGYYFHAVEEAYKIVRQKLRDVSGHEKATDAFNASNYEKIFGHQPQDLIEKDFFDGVKYLHMAIQFLRNEKAHTPSQELDPNLAIHYISLASLAYDLINRTK